MGDIYHYHSYVFYWRTRKILFSASDDLSHKILAKSSAVNILIHLVPLQCWPENVTYIMALYPHMWDIMWDKYFLHLVGHMYWTKYLNCSVFSGISSSKTFQKASLTTEIEHHLEASSAAIWFLLLVLSTNRCKRHLFYFIAVMVFIEMSKLIMMLANTFIC